MLVLLLPTMIWIKLRVQWISRIFEFLCLLPLTIPAIALVVGLAPVYNRIQHYSLSALQLFWVYVILALPYAYRALASGLDAIDAVTLAEAARSLGANWFTVMFRVIAPNMRQAILNSLLLTGALVLGEFTIAYLLLYNTLQPTLYSISRNTPNAGVIFSTSLASLLFAFALLIDRVLCRTPAAPGMRNRSVSSPVTSAQGAVARTAVEVRMEGLTRRYGPVTALDGLDLTLQPGELIALLGPVRLRQDHHAAAAGRAGGRRRRDRSRSAAGTSPGCRPASGTWAWCSRPTRCSRT